MLRRLFGRGPNVVPDRDLYFWRNSSEGFLSTWYWAHGQRPPKQ